MERINKASMLVAGVPRKCGSPVHIEHDDMMAMCVHGADGKVKELHTPQMALQRIHEMLHARHSSAARQKKQYRDVRDTVRQFTEDARIHGRFWPWRRNNTPPSIEMPCRDYIATELAEVAKKVEEAGTDPDKVSRVLWPAFAIRFRAAAVFYGLEGRSSFGVAMRRAGMRDYNEQDLALKAMRLIEKGKEGKAARLIETAFFPPLPPPPQLPPGFLPKPKEGKSKIGKGRKGSGPTMDVIELSHTVPVNDSVGGYKLTSSGPRLHRPSLRKLGTTTRLFVRRAAVEPQGTILIDASGSMGDFDEIRRWCERSPYATVAYYSGDGHSHGWLHVYARDGYRASEAKQPECQGNTVDGPAMTWLMAQPGPRVMVTDRGFCDVADSDAQILRLKNLERAGEITVKAYL